MRTWDYEKNIKLKHHEAPAKINKETGEVTILGESNTIEISYNNYIMIDTATLKTLVDENLLTRVEKGYIVEFATMLRTQYNAIFNNNVPHTIDSLSEYFEMNYNRMSSTLKTLTKKGILAKLDTGDRKMYILNPYLARKRKYIDSETALIFKKFTHKKVSKTGKIE